MSFYINLLPWRSQKRQYEKRRFHYYLLVLILLSSFIVLLLNAYLNHLIQYQTITYNQLMDRKTKLDLAIRQANERKAQWMKAVLKKKFIHKVYSNRDSIIRVITFLQQIIPERPPAHRLTLGVGT